jgi:hypothetical protein
MPLCARLIFQAKERIRKSCFEGALSFSIVDEMNRMMLETLIMKGIAPNCSVREVCMGERFCHVGEPDIIGLINTWRKQEG